MPIIFLARKNNESKILASYRTVVITKEGERKVLPHPEDTFINEDDYTRVFREYLYFNEKTNNLEYNEIGNVPSFPLPSIEQKEKFGDWELSFFGIS